MPLERGPDQLSLEKALELGIRKVRRDAVELDAFPHTTLNGRWRVSTHGRWTAGFFIGMLWLAELVDPDPRSGAILEKWTERLRPRAVDRSTHDMGFLFEPSFVRGFRVVGAPALRATAITAARSLATRFRPDGRYIEAWDDPGYKGVAIVDTIMNLPLLLWAAAETGDRHLRRVAEAGAETIRRQHVRTDGSTCHVVRHWPANARTIEHETLQGASPDSCWSRGQAWALYGFSRMSRMLDSDRLLGTALRLADYFLLNIEDTALPPWDFLRTQRGEPRDSAAAAIAASGLLELSRVSGDTRYRDGATRLLGTLIREAVDFDHPDSDGLLKHGSVDVPHDSGIDVSIVYGDHYFMEALVKLLCGTAAWDRLGCVEWA